VAKYVLAIAAGVALAFGVAVVAKTETLVPCTDPRGCPDLIVDSRAMNDAEISTETFTADSCSVQEGEVVEGTRTLLRFTTSTPNLGEGDLFIGRVSEHPELFEFAPCHNHHHLREYSDYRFWTEATYAQWKALKAANPNALSADLLTANPSIAPVTGHKQGFCVIDVERYKAGSDVNRHLTYGTCDDTNKFSCTQPPAPGVDPVQLELYCSQGLSKGWTDRYGKSLDGQWVDITGLPAGNYVLEVEVNAERLFGELDYTNNSGTRKITIR
jgi:Lysyl oxidase